MNIMFKKAAVKLVQFIRHASDEQILELYNDLKPYVNKIKKAEKAKQEIINE